MFEDTLLRRNKYKKKHSKHLVDSNPTTLDYEMFALPLCQVRYSVQIHIFRFLFKNRLCSNFQLFMIDNCADDWRIAMTWQRIAQVTNLIQVCSYHPDVLGSRPHLCHFCSRRHRTEKLILRILSMKIALTFNSRIFSQEYD